MNKSQISSIDFVINGFFMKLFTTNNIEIVKCCQHAGVLFQSTKYHFGSSHQIFLGQIRQYEKLRIFLSKDSCVCEILYFVTLPAIDVFFFSCESVGVSHCMCIWTALFHTLFLSYVVYFI